MFQDSSEELAQSKLLLLYIINMSPYPFNKDQLTEYILERDLLNYFSIQEYINELLEGGFIKILETDKYQTLEKGREALNYFDAKIPLHIKTQLKSDFLLDKASKEKESQIIAEYFEKENKQYMVNLKLVEKDEILFSLYLSVPSLDQASLISKTWKDDPDLVYGSIMNIFAK